jgi:hypothetical protein
MDFDSLPDSSIVEKMGSGFQKGKTGEVEHLKTLE